MGGIAVSAGICEESLFRGFIQNGLEQNWGSTKALLVAAILFGVFHIDPWRGPPAIVMGIVAGYLLLKTRSLYTSISFHITLNTLGQLLTYLNYSPEPETVSWALILLLSLGFVASAMWWARKHEKAATTKYFEPTVVSK